jgi:hypothetical protein
MSDEVKKPRKRRTTKTSPKSPVAEPISTADLDDVVGGSLQTQTERWGGGGSSGGGGSGGSY